MLKTIGIAALAGALAGGALTWFVAARPRVEAATQAKLRAEDRAAEARAAAERANAATNQCLATRAAEADAIRRRDDAADRAQDRERDDLGRVRERGLDGLFQTRPDAPAGGDGARPPDRAPDAPPLRPDAR